MKIKFFSFLILICGSFILTLAIRFMFTGYLISFLPQEPYSLVAWYIRISVFIMPYIGIIFGWAYYIQKEYMNAILAAVIIGFGPLLLGCFIG